MSLERLLCFLLTICVILLILRVLLSWFPFNPEGKMAAAVGFVYLLTDFAVLPLRRVLPQPQFGALRLDLSIVFLLLCTQLLNRVVCGGL